MVGSHAQVVPHSEETEVEVGTGEREGMRDGYGLAVFDPFVHSPEVGVAEIQLEGVNETGNQRQLFGRSNRPTDTRWI
jgi:hypothetical protein